MSRTESRAECTSRFQIYFPAGYSDWFRLILFEPYIIEREHWNPDPVRLALENSERGGDSARKCSVRFGTVRGSTVR